MPPKAKFSPEERKSRAAQASARWRTRNPDRVKARELADRRSGAMLERNRLYRRIHPEKARQQSKESSRRWIENNREKSRLKAKLYRSKYPDRFKDQCLQWRQRNIESLRKKWRQYAKDNLPKILVLNRLRRSRKNNIPGSHTEKEWINLCAQFENRCVCCGIKSKLTRDHVVPITNPGSSDFIENIQPLCQSCNSKKGNYNTLDYRLEPFTGRGQGILFG